MPALAQIRKHALTIKCMANLDQFGNAWALYFNDYDGRFPGGEDQEGFNYGTYFWWYSLFPYYKAHKLRFCPVATDVDARPPFRPYNLMGISELSPISLSTSSWPHVSDDTRRTLWNSRTSYGINDCIYNYTEEEYQLMEEFGLGWLTTRKWRTSDVKGAGTVPVMLDCSVQGSAAWYNTAEPPYYEDDVTSSGGPGPRSEMKRFFVNRHPNFRTNALFMDFSVKKVAMKAINSLKWARNWDTAGPWTLAGGADYDVWADHGDGWLKDAPYE